MAKLIKSPLNYTGNKYRILPQLQHFFPKKINCMIDLFCGGATVGLNVEADKIIFVDNNPRIINLLIFLAKQSFDDFLAKLERLTVKYNLSYSYKYGYKMYRNLCSNKTDNNGLKDYNKNGYYKLRRDYNALTDKTTDKANTLLYLLMVYAFNNDMRFNSNDEFNLPIGKTDLNKMNVMKIKAYIDRINKIDAEFICLDFNDPYLLNYVAEADFIYMDPPYLVGDAVYNASWNNKQEYLLMDFLDKLLELKKNFALSNVIYKVGKINEPLSYWCYKKGKAICIHDIEYNYKSASYNKITRDAKEKEVLIANRGYNENKQ